MKDEMKETKERKEDAATAPDVDVKLIRLKVSRREEHRDTGIYVQLDHPVQQLKCASCSRPVCFGSSLDLFVVAAYGTVGGQTGLNKEPGLRVNNTLKVFVNGQKCLFEC